MFFTVIAVHAQKSGNSFRVIAYYSSNATKIDSFQVDKLTHIIYSFCHLRGNKLAVDNDRDSLTIQKLVSLKSAHPKLKILLSLGGWGGCKTCSDVFSTEQRRREFAASVKALADYFRTDGIDLDWEYPTIEGHPGHPYQLADKENFTALVKALRTSLGKKQEISFAAGGFKKYLEESVDWKNVMPVVDYVNLMTYDLVNGATPHTGHHTPLYSTKQQSESTDACVNYLDSIGVPKNKMVIGAAFYGRSWREVESINNGLYQPGVFKSFIPYRIFESSINKEKGFEFYYDEVAKASYAYNAKEKVFATFDDAGSITKKTNYAVDNGLGGIMFWELSLDKNEGGYLNVIDHTIKSRK
ncbi:glycoside hydrolase family 18 protein [Niabella ginsengisoli]|uniref:chitinase n=1 Tax=Niabella ginsengisoli TaxID=522298 RepID=A0ABS9SE07_9BACT|nr:glycoside hydrolase family 18 protein [Niabella ginsengisoli]MCH5596591.1 glycoside hydrolase family 18 protein [Niabella ginsengisoli]